MANLFAQHITSKPTIAAFVGNLASGPVVSYVVNYLGRTVTALAQLKIVPQLANILGLVNAISDVAVKYFVKKDSYARNLGPVAGAAAYYTFNYGRGIAVDTKTLAIMTVTGVALSWAADRFVKAGASKPDLNPNKAGKKPEAQPETQPETQPKNDEEQQPQTV